jgi:hypothetical protein
MIQAFIHADRVGPLQDDKTWGKYEEHMPVFQQEIADLILEDLVEDALNAILR